MQVFKTGKRMATVITVLALLVGMVSVMGPFPTVDAAEQVMEDVWSFSGEWAESGFTDANKNAVDAAFNVYAGCEAAYTKVAKADLGADNDGGNEWSSSIVQLQTAAKGLTMHNSIGSYSNLTMRNYMSLVAKDANGAEILVKDFEVSFKLTTQLKWSNGGFMLQFGSQGNGRAAVSANTPYNDRGAVLITADGYVILDGAGHGENTVLYQKPQTLAGFTKFPAGYNTGNGNGTSAAMNVTIKVLNGKLTLKITKDGEANPFVEVEKDINWNQEGVIAFTGLLGDNTVSDMALKKANVKYDFTFKPDFSAAGSTFPYDFSADNAVNNDIRNTIDAAFNVYAGCEAAYTKVAKADLGADNDGGNEWSSSITQLQVARNGLTMHSSVGSYSGLTMRNYISLVPKNANGEEYVARNFEVSFKLTTQMKWSTGGFMLQFGSQGNGRAAVSNNTPYAQRAAVLITSNGAAILDGAAASSVNETLYKNPTNIAEITTFPANGTTNGVSPELAVTVRVQDGTVNVAIAKADGSAPFLELEEKITWLEAGTIAFTGLLMDHTVSNIELNVEEEEVKEPDYIFEADFSAAGSTFPYDFSADNAVNNNIRDAVDAAFNVYAGCESDFGKVEKVDLGKDNDFNNDWNGSVSQLKATANGLNMYNFVSTYDNNTMRNYLSLVPKNAQGNEIYAKDFEISFRLTTSMKWSNGAFMLQFGSQDSGRAAVSPNTPYASRAAVLITSAGAMILDGAAGSAVDETLYKKPQTSAAISAFPSGYGATNGTAPEMEVYVKVLDGKVTVKLTKVGEGAPFLELEDDITWVKEGTIAFTGLLMDHAVSNVKLTLLEGTDQGGEGEEDVDKPENTETVKDLVDSGRAMTLGRVTWEGTTAKLPWALAGVRIAGNLYGKVTAKMQASSSPGSFVTVVVDGDYENATTTWVETGITTFTAVENLEEGYHTVEILRSSSAPYAATSIFNISYNGTLEMPTYGDFQMEFIGDSITGGEGNWDTSQGKNTYSVQFCNSYETYAAKTARALGAEINVLATCGWTTAQATSAFSGLGNPDIVVINLGTNLYGIDDAQLTSDVKALIAKVRAAYGEDTYIVWAYGMMYTEKVAVIEAAVDEMAAADEKLFFCDLSAAQNQAGTNKHPDAQGHTDAANILVPFLRAKCGLKEVIVDTFEQGTVETVKSPVEGSETLVQYTFTVIPEEGAQLKAGSLKARVKGSDGAYTIMPQRVGFRDPANLQSEQFVFVAEGELEITAEFYTPADAKDANMAMLATSKSTVAMGGQYGNAVRFVSRSYVYENGGKFYMDIDGQAKEVQDFGMYVTSRMALDRMGFDTIAGALQNGQTKNIVKRSVPEAGQAIGKLGVFYDYCSAYADMSIQIININDAHVDREIVSCAYVLFADGQVVYTDDAARSHSEA